MNAYQQTLYTDLMRLCSSNEAFYFVDQSFNGKDFRVFTYRLASYTDFLNPNATECRGHTFRMVNGQPVMLVSLPMQKFFNAYENPLTMNLDLSIVTGVYDKLDGSLISTVFLHDENDFTLKSKTSFASDQSAAANSLIRKDIHLFNKCLELVLDGFTVNMEFCSPDNRIVLGYMEPSLKVLNVRNNLNGAYMDYSDVLVHFGSEYVVKSHVVDNAEHFVKSIPEMKGIEGFVVTLANGLWFKVKTDEYCALHKTKDSVNSPRRLFEVCVHEGADDLRALFAEDVLAVAKIDEMQAMVSHNYNFLHKLVTDFYVTNKSLDRKSYAILGQQELNPHGAFSMAMNLYIGRDIGLKDFMIKNYKRFGIKDEDPE